MLQRPLWQPLPQGPQVLTDDVHIELWQLCGLLLEIASKLPVGVEPVEHGGVILDPPKPFR